MNPDRRSFFKLSAGAAVAAPVAMKQVAGGMLDSAATESGGYGMIGASLQSIPPSPVNVREALSDQAKRLAAVNAPKPDHVRNLDPIIAQRIDGLRSVSGVNKARMMVEALEERQRQRQRGWIQERIDNLKKQLGPLGDPL